MFEAACDRCTAPLGFAVDGYAWHFPSPEAALAELTDFGWARVRGRIVCALCLSRQACELLGHTWSEWTPFEIPAHCWGGYSGLRRTCELCPDTEEDPPLSLDFPDRKQG